MWFLLAAGVRPKETKINLTGCICLCSEVEISIFQHEEAHAVLLVDESELKL